MQHVYETAKGEMAADQAAIFEAHLMMLEDPELLGSIRNTITERKLNAEFAVKEATEHYARALEVMDNDYFKSRAADVRDIATRLLRILLGVNNANTNQPTQPSIIIAKDLTPSDTVLLDKHTVLGFCTAVGSENSHTAILARALGIPAVVGGGLEVLSIPDDILVILDGLSGKVFIDPTAKIVE